VSGTRFVVLLVTVLTGGSILLGGLIWVARLLWNIRGAWDATNSELAALVGDVKELVVRKDKDHDEFRERLTWLERRELAQRRKEDQ
jgi:hypothetical protein